MIDDHADNQLDVEPEEQEDVTHVDYNIASYPSDFTLSGFNEMYKKGDIEIPDYQREFVWNIRQASLLIDSFLRGLPVPAVFFYIGADNKKIVIDGQQRIKSIAYYFAGHFGERTTSKKQKVFHLTGLAKNSPYHNKSFAELDKSTQRHLENAVLRATNIQQLNPKEDITSAYHIFQRLNTGGTLLLPQEIRNGIFQGAFNDALKKANEDANWRKILGMRDMEKHQRDVELLLRVFALFAAGDRYKKPMKEFLNKRMEGHRAGKTEETKRFFNVFVKATEKMVLACGEKPFHLKMGHLNRPALDSVMSVLTRNAQRLDRIDIKKCYAKLCRDKMFLEFIHEKTTDTKAVKGRIKRVEEIMLG